MLFRYIAMQSVWQCVTHQAQFCTTFNFTVLLVMQVWKWFEFYCCNRYLCIIVIFSVIYRVSHREADWDHLKFINNDLPCCLSATAPYMIADELVWLRQKTSVYISIVCSQVCTVHKFGGDTFFRMQSFQTTNNKL